MRKYILAIHIILFFIGIFCSEQIEATRRGEGQDMCQAAATGSTK